MNHILFKLFATLCILFFQAVQSGSVLAQGQLLRQQWVHGSWVNVRAAPTTEAKVLTQLVVNTPVQVDVARNKNDFCFIAWGDAQTGFIACKLLGDQPLHIDQIGARYLDAQWTPNPQYSPTRAFWLQPSLQRLMDAGNFFWESMLTPAQKEKEEASINSNGAALPALIRFPIPEFEAMKARLIEGLIEPRALHIPPPSSWQELKTALAKVDVHAKESSPAISRFHISFFNTATLQMLQQIQLPKIAPSFFTSQAEIAPPSATTEALSAQFQIPYAIKINSGAFFYNGGEVGGGITKVGVWDIGKYETYLKNPVYKNTLAINGKLSSAQSLARTNVNWDGDCHDGFLFGGDAKQSMPIKSLSSKRASSEPVFHFYTPGPMPTMQAKLSYEPLQTHQPVQHKYGNRSEYFHQGSLAFFDLNQDGIADFAVWEGWRIFYPYQNQAPEPNYRMLFANVNGAWSLFDIDQYYLCDE